eukprot:8270560-Heterocapsa_arctica.AAC.1
MHQAECRAPAVESRRLAARIEFRDLHQDPAVEEAREGSPEVHPDHAALVVVQDLVSECHRFNEEIATHIASQERSSECVSIEGGEEADGEDVGAVMAKIP